MNEVYIVLASMYSSAAEQRVQVVLQPMPTGCCVDEHHINGRVTEATIKHVIADLNLHGPSPTA